MNYWWVNQNGTYKFEVPGNFLWSPKTKRNGAKNQFYDYMKAVQAGDVVFSFCDTQIKAVGVATGPAESRKKPEFREAGSAWADDGWYVPVEFTEFTHPIRPKDHIDDLVDLLPEKYAPLQKNGNGLQAVYLTHLSEPFAHALITLIGSQYASILANIANLEVDKEIIGNMLAEAIIGRTDIGQTTKTSLIKARRGQGVFKGNVRQNENCCRVTGEPNIQHLIASHIKPWAASNDSEKLSGCNGLLLSPHVDHLFDNGYISFQNNGQLLISTTLDASVLARWGIAANLNVGTFNAEQQNFLEYHRSNVFK